MIMLGSLTLDQIRLFLAVADAGSFSKAARQLNRAQSAVTYGIRSAFRYLTAQRIGQH
jgi:DNA-binding transcriptional LysR family regulator